MVSKVYMGFLRFQVFTLLNVASSIQVPLNGLTSLLRDKLDTTLATQLRQESECRCSDSESNAPINLKHIQESLDQLTEDFVVVINALIPDIDSASLYKTKNESKLVYEHDWPKHCMKLSITWGYSASKPEKISYPQMRAPTLDNIQKIPIFRVPTTKNNKILDNLFPFTTQFVKEHGNIYKKVEPSTSNNDSDESQAVDDADVDVEAAQTNDVNVPSDINSSVNKKLNSYYDMYDSIRDDGRTPEKKQTGKKQGRLPEDEIFDKDLTSGYDDEISNEDGTVLNDKDEKKPDFTFIIP